MPTISAARARSRQRSWTYADYCRIPEDGKRHEIIDGRHYVTPSPDTGHQWASGQLFYELTRKITKRGRGFVYSAPLDVHLGRGSVLQPDIIVVHNRNEGILDKKKVRGVPDLLIEVLSPSSRGRDMSVKKGRYERAGVPEYWVVNWRQKAVEQFVLRDGKYDPPIVCRDRLRVRILRGVTIDLRQVWQGPATPCP
jgi:Uma2 family endonuclease